MRREARLRASMLEQLARRREVLAAGAHHVGWKIGQGESDSVEGFIGVGYITSVSHLSPGETFDPEGTAVDLRADVELAVELGLMRHARLGCASVPE